jgi:hypothetical protein
VADAAAPGIPPADHTASRHLGACDAFARDQIDQRRPAIQEAQSRLESQRTGRGVIATVSGLPAGSRQRMFRVRLIRDRRVVSPRHGPALDA